MKRVYAIHTGCYSDQGWGPVFSSVEKAQAYIDNNTDLDRPNIEVYVLDDKDDGTVYPAWRVLFGRDGNVLYVGEGFGSVPFEPLLHHPDVRPVPANCYWALLDNLTSQQRQLAYLLVDLYAKDKDYAIKIAADAKTKYEVLHLIAQGRPDR